MRILQVYRSKKLNMFSIENCFSNLDSFFSKDIEIEKCYVPYPRADIKSILKNALYVKKLLKNKRYDIVHVTGDVHYVCLFLPKNKAILTIHDLRGIHNYSGLKLLLYKLLWIHLPVHKCKSIVCISRFTENELFSVSKKAKSKSTIIPDPINCAFLKKEKEFNFNCPNILMIGTIPNKNIERAVQALSHVRCLITIIGRLSEKQKEVLIRSGLVYKNLFGISDNEIRNQYEECDIVLFPSLYEGFGMVVVEGQKVGRVVVTSNVEPLISVAGSGACLVDPYDIESIKSGVLAVINNEEYRNTLIQNGFKNAEKYSAETIATMYGELYKTFM